MFKSARTKLTLWYVIIISIISGLISLLFYMRTTSTLETEFDRIEKRLQRELFIEDHMPARHFGRRLLPEDIDQAKSEIAGHLITINILIIGVTAIAGYALSGITLKPIEKALDDQKRFVADAAHELRTPVTAMKVSLETQLLDKKLSKSTQELINGNLQDIRVLEQLTQNLLRLAQSEQKPIHFETVSIASVIKTATARIAANAAEKEIMITFSDPTKITVKGDRAALVSICTILLDNAIKYSEPKTEVKVTATHAGRKFALIKVIDQGMGIPKKDIPHIFKRFYRADQSRARSSTSDGYGLGLSVAHNLVKEHHGSIAVESSPKGSTFSLRLPLA